MQQSRLGHDSLVAHTRSQTIPALICHTTYISSEMKSSQVEGIKYYEKLIMLSRSMNTNKAPPTQTFQMLVLVSKYAYIFFLRNTHNELMCITPPATLGDFVPQLERPGTPHRGQERRTTCRRHGGHRDPIITDQPEETVRLGPGPTRLGLPTRPNHSRLVHATSILSHTAATPVSAIGTKPPDIRKPCRWINVSTSTDTGEDYSNPLEVGGPKRRG